MSKIWLERTILPKGFDLLKIVTFVGVLLIPKTQPFPFENYLQHLCHCSHPYREPNTALWWVIGFWGTHQNHEESDWVVEVVISLGDGVKSKYMEADFPLGFISPFWRIYVEKINLFFQSLFTKPLPQVSNFSSVTTSSPSPVKNIFPLSQCYPWL